MPLQKRDDSVYRIEMMNRLALSAFPNLNNITCDGQYTAEWPEARGERVDIFAALNLWIPWGPQGVFGTKPIFDRELSNNVSS